jgi:hypothetical protein
LDTSPTLWRVNPSNGDVTIPDFSVAEVAKSLNGS